MSLIPLEITNNFVFINDFLVFLPYISLLENLLFYVSRVTLKNILGHVSLRFFEAMTAEHRTMAGCEFEFSKVSKKGSTNHKPSTEWQIVMEREGKGDKWSGNRRLMSPSHVIPDVKELMELESS